MKIQIESQVLARAMNIVKGSSQFSPAMPILGNVKIETAGEHSVFTTTDLERFCSHQCECMVDQPGAITIPTKIISNIVSMLPSGNVTIEGDEGTVRLDVNGLGYELSSLPVDDFPNAPVIEEFDSNNTVLIDCEQLKKAIERTVYAVPAKDPRRVLSGVLFECKPGSFTLVATDGRMLGKFIIPTEDENEFKMVIPINAVNELYRQISLMPEGKNTIHFLNKGNRLVADTPISLMHLMLIEGKYPDYNAVIPKEFNHDVIINRTALVSLVKQAAVTSDDKWHGVHFEIAGNKLSAWSESKGTGKYHGAIELKSEHKKMSVAFCSKYLTETLGILECVDVTMKIKDTKSPVIFIDDSAPEATALVMPIAKKDMES